MDAKTRIARILREEGVEFVASFPMNPLIDALAREGIRPLKFRTERVAVNVADGFSRASFGKKIGVALMQFGPGIENAFPGIAHAFADSVPILLLPSGVDRRRKVPPAFDAVSNLREVTKWVDEITFADRCDEMLRRAFTALKAGRPGPVVLVMPQDVLTETVSEAHEYTKTQHIRTGADPVLVEEAVRMLLSAECAVVRAGGGVLYAEAWHELLQLAESLSLPVFTTQNGKSCFPEDHALSLGTGGRTRPDGVLHWLRKADVVFAVGSSCTNEPYTTPLPPGKLLIQQTIDERDINKDYPVACGIMGDSKIVLGQMLEEVNRQLGKRGLHVRRDPREEIRRVREHWLRKWVPKLESQEVPLNPYRVIADIQKVFDEPTTIVTHDAGSPRDQMIPFYRSNTPGSYIGWGKSTTLGQSLGLSMGAKLANPEKTVIAVMGDAAFGMVGMDVESMVREQIPIIVVVLNNSMLGGYRSYLPAASELYKYDQLSGDYCGLARALGVAHAERVTLPEQIVPALQKARERTERGTPAFLEFVTKEETEFSNYPLRW